MTCACRALKKTLPSNIRHWVFLIHLGWETTLEKDPIQRPARLSQAYLSHTRASEEKHPGLSTQKQLTGTYRRAPVTATWMELSKENRPLGCKSLACLRDQRTPPRRSREGPSSFGDQGTLPGGAEGKLAPFGIKEHCQEGLGDSVPQGLGFPPQANRHGCSQRKGRAPKLPPTTFLSPFSLSQQRKSFYLHAAMLPGPRVSLTGPSGTFRASCNLCSTSPQEQGRPPPRLSSTQPHRLSPAASPYLCLQKSRFKIVRDQTQRTGASRKNRSFTTSNISATFCHVQGTGDQVPEQNTPGFTFSPSP